MKPLTKIQKGILADWEMCDAICAVPECWEGALESFGPVPLDYGCCEQEAGDGLGGDSDMLKNFSVWAFHPRDTDYPLAIRRSSTGTAAPTSAARFIAQTNRLVGGLIIRQTRKSERDCSRDRFSKLEDSLPYLNNTFVKQVGCKGRSEDQGTAPFGADPTFISTSDLFVPGAKPENYYAPEQINNDRKVPYGARAPQSCLPLTRPTPVATLTPTALGRFLIVAGFFADSNGEYSIFFDVDFDASQANRLLTFMQQARYPAWSSQLSHADTMCIAFRDTTLFNENHVVCFRRGSTSISSRT